MKRILKRAKFTGDIEPNQIYIIVDDAVTTGGELTELRHYIENKGGKVVLATTLAAHKYSTILVITPKTLAKLKEKFNVKELEALLRDNDISGSLAALTESEGRNIGYSKTIDELRDKIAKARLEGNTKLYSLFQDSEFEQFTPTNLTPQELQAKVETVQAEIEQRFGKGTVRQLIKNGALKIVKTVAELPQGLTSQTNQTTRGIFDPETGTAYLVAENLGEGRAAGVFLHEIGEHAALKDMLGEKQYDDLSTNFDELLNSKDEVTVAAKERVPKNTAKEDVASENLAYLVQEVQDREGRGEVVGGKVKQLYNRIMNLIKKWIRSVPAFRKLECKAALKKLEQGVLLSSQNIASLARVAVDFQAQRGATKQVKALKFSVGDSKFEDVNQRLKDAKATEEENMNRRIMIFIVQPQIGFPSTLPRPESFSLTQLSPSPFQPSQFCTYQHSYLL